MMFKRYLCFSVFLILFAQIPLFAVEQEERAPSSGPQLSPAIESEEYYLKNKHALSNYCSSRKRGYQCTDNFTHHLRCCFEINPELAREIMRGNIKEQRKGFSQSHLGRLSGEKSFMFFDLVHEICSEELNSFLDVNVNVIIESCANHPEEKSALSTDHSLFWSQIISYLTSNLTTTPSTPGHIFHTKAYATLLAKCFGQLDEPAQTTILETMPQIFDNYAQFESYDAIRLDFVKTEKPEQKTKAWLNYLSLVGKIKRSQGVKRDFNFFLSQFLHANNIDFLLSSPDFYNDLYVVLKDEPLSVQMLWRHLIKHEIKMPLLAQASNYWRIRLMPEDWHEQKTSLDAMNLLIHILFSRKIFR